MAQQTLHGYSEGHRRLGSSIELQGRDAKTMLMMSDASGPAADIGDEGYLTGYPLSESGYYALARTWPAPEMARPGCVWTHTILLDFSDIPGIETAAAMFRHFRRPLGDVRSYCTALSFDAHVRSSGLPPSEAVRRILQAVYAHPLSPVISSSLEQRERDDLVIALWDQQWPRLKRAFRFCTLSFADRSSSAGTFDLQFLPSTGRVPRAQFRTALDADRLDLTSADWLDDAASDLNAGPEGDLRRFLRVAGSDLGGRGAFAPLTSLHALSRNFPTERDSVVKAIALLEQSIPEMQGRAARTLIVGAALAVADRLDPSGLIFVVDNFDLIETDLEAAAVRVGSALWRRDPNAVAALLGQPTRRFVAESALAALPTAALLKGASEHPHLLRVLLDARPDLATEPGYWSLPDAWNVEALHGIANRLESEPRVVDAMVQSKRPSVGAALEAFGGERILRHLVVLAEGGENIMSDVLRHWLTAACSDAGAVAGVLAGGAITRGATLAALARTIDPDGVPNDVGEDPWLSAVRGVQISEVTLYLSTYLLARAFGPRPRSLPELIEFSFDTVYVAVEQSTLPEDAWRLLDRRLHQPYLWQSWDRCLRIRRTAVAAYIERDADPAAFGRITGRDDVFTLLVEGAANAFGGQRYLKSVRDHIAHDASRARRRAIKKALW